MILKNILTRLPGPHTSTHTHTLTFTQTHTRAYDVKEILMLPDIQPFPVKSLNSLKVTRFTYPPSILSLPLPPLALSWHSLGIITTGVQPRISK